MSSITKKQFLLVALVLFVALVVPEIVHAGFLETITNPAKFVSTMFKGISYVFAFLIGQFLILGGALVHIMLDLNFKVLSDQNSIVHVGWRIVRDIANLGFVIVIIIIAFATILRKEQYGVKKLLPKLIAAAILVNFSLAIAGVFIDFSNVFTNFFISKTAPAGESGIANFSSNLTNVFGPQRFFIEGDTITPSPFGDDEAGEIGFGAAALIGISGLIFTIAFTLLTALVMFAFALMLFVRYLYLTFLVIVSPIVWLFWVFPALSKEWNKWWHKFLQWVFFAPAVSFFMYLALISVEQVGEIRAEVAGGGFFVGTMKNVMLQGVQMIVLAGILVAGLLMAQNMGIKGAGGAINLASKAGKGARAWAGRRGVNMGRRALTARTKEGKTGLERFGVKYGKVPLLGKLATGVSGISTRAKTQMTKGVDDQIAKLEPRTAEDVANLAKGAAGGASRLTGEGWRVDSPQTLAALAIASSRKQVFDPAQNKMVKVWDTLPKDFQNRMISALKQTGSGDKILATSPELATKLVPQRPGESDTAFKERAVDHALSKVEKPEENLTKGIFDDRGIGEAMARAMSKYHLTEVGNKGLLEAKIAAKDAMIRGMGTNGAQLVIGLKNIEKALKEIEDAKASGDNAGAQQLIAQRSGYENNLKRLLRGTSAGEKKAFENYKVISTKNVNWQDAF